MRPRGRYLLAVLKGALVGALVGAALSSAFVYLSHPGPTDAVGRELLNVSAACGAFFGAPSGMWVGIIGPEFRLRRSRTSEPGG